MPVFSFSQNLQFEIGPIFMPFAWDLRYNADNHQDSISVNYFCQLQRIISYKGSQDGGVGNLQ